jgi:L-seryl-tRNA(Ser) seleniumtransferase
MSGGRSAFDSAVRLTGAKLVLAQTLERVEAAIGPSTAMIYTTDLGDNLQRTVAIARKANVPLLLDDVAGIPPI